APNRYTVTLGAADHDRLAGDEQRVIRMLKGCIQSHLAEQAWDIYGGLVVSLERSATLHTGQFRTSSSVDPDTSQPRSAGDRAMTQQPAPDYGQPAGYDFSDSRYVQDGYQPGRGYTPANQASYPQLSASLTLDDGSDRYYQLTEGATVVGRGQDAQFRLPDTGVSRRHVEITWDGQTAMLTDLGSTNGTTVNGAPVQSWQLVDGDVVRVGQSRLVFRTQG
ncbi:MAG: FhaA domain-containing protein, partial [Pseudonocardiaceae bacterium]